MVACHATHDLFAYPLVSHTYEHEHTQKKGELREVVIRTGWRHKDGSINAEIFSSFKENPYLKPSRSFQRFGILSILGCSFQAYTVGLWSFLKMLGAASTTRFLSYSGGKPYFWSNFRGGTVHGFAVPNLSKRGSCGQRTCSTCFDSTRAQTVCQKINRVLSTVLLKETDMQAQLMWTVWNDNNWQKQTTGTRFLSRSDHNTVTPDRPKQPKHVANAR